MSKVSIVSASLSLAALVLAGCVSYRARPLDGPDAEAMLASPDRAALARQVAQLSHPLLAPLPIDFSRPLDAAQVAVLAVVSNPELRALRKREQVADAQAFAAGLLPDPSVSLGFDKVLAPTDQGLSTAVAGGLTLELLGALAARPLDRRAARASANQVRLDIAWQEWITAGQAWLLALRLPRQRLAAQLAQAVANATEDTLRRTLAAAARGDLKGEDVEARRIAAADASARALSTQRDADVTRLGLNRVLGLTPNELLALAEPPALAQWVAPNPDELFALARAQRLDLQALASGYGAQEAGLARAVLGQYPRLSISVHRARDTSLVQTLGPAVSFDLPLWNRARGAIAVARAGREQARLEYFARLHQTRAEIAALIVALNRDEQSRAVLAAQLPDLERIAVGFEAAAARGDVTLPLAQTARAGVTDKRLSYLSLDQACAEQRLALALAVGRPFTQSSSKP